MPFPCLGEDVVLSEDPEIQILNCGETLTSGALSVQFSASNMPDGARVDLWVKHQGLSNGLAQDVASSVLPEAGLITNNVSIPQDGSDFTVCLRYATAPDYNFAAAEDLASCTFTSYTPIFNSEVIEFDFFCLKQPTAESRAYFGCSGENYGGYVVPTVPSNIDLTTSSESAAQAFIDTMQPGQVLRIQNANGWSLDCSSFSGSENNKKWIIGESDCDGSGPQTSNGNRFIVEGDHFAFANMEINRAGSFLDRIWIMRGSNNLVYNVKTTNAGLCTYGSSTLGGPKGSYGNPGTVGNKFVKIHSTGAGHSFTNAWFGTLSSFNNATGATSQDTLIAGCYVQDYGAIGTDGSGKALTDVSWWWNSPWHAGNGASPGPAPEIYFEVVGCHFVNNLDETLTCKNDKFWVHQNLFESNNGGHISLRSGDNHCVNGNFVFSDLFAIRMSGGYHEGYFNLFYSGGNRGIGVSNSVAQDEGGGSVFPSRAQNIENVFKHNFVLGSGSSGGYLRALFLDDDVPQYPSQDSEIAQNIYIGPPADISPYGTATGIAQAGADATQAGYDADNPLSTVDDQIWSTRTSGDCFQTPELVEMPTEVDTGKTWIDGRSMKATIRPEFIGPGGLFIDTSV